MRSKLTQQISQIKLSCILCLALVCVASTLSLPCAAEINAKLNSDYLEREYEWAMYVEVHDLQQYLNYTGSKLHPLTKAWVYLRNFRKTDAHGNIPAAQVYEEMWYYKTTPIGSQRRIAVEMPHGRVGAVVLGKGDGNQNRAMVATNVALREIIDLLVKGVQVGMLLVPVDNYDLVVESLASYGFRQKDLPTGGKQTCLMIRSYPSAREDRLYLE